MQQLKFVHSQNAKGRKVTLQFDATNKLILMLRSSGEEGFAISWKAHDGRWYYQYLHWSCRAGKAFWYRPLIAFYRYIRQNKLSDYNLRYLAGAEKCLLRNGGYAFGTETHTNWVRIGQRLAAQRKREEALSTLLTTAMTGLQPSDRWRLEVLPRDYYVLQEQTTAYGDVTGCITVNLTFERIRVQRVTGLASRPNDTDPFRTMGMRREHDEVHFQDPDRSPEQLVNAAMAQVQQYINERSAEPSAPVAQAA